MQIRTLGIHQGEDDEPTRELLHDTFSAGSFRLVHLPWDDSTTTRHPDNAQSVEDRDLHNQDDEDDEEDEEDEEEIQISYWRRPHAKTPKWFPPVTKPQGPGKRLLVSGEFGRIGVETRSRDGCPSFARAILSRQNKLRQTPMQDVTNVSRVYVLVYPVLSYDRRPLSPIVMVQPSPPLPIIYTADNTQLVRMLSDYCIFGYLMHAFQILPSITHAVGVWRVPPSPHRAPAELLVDFRLHIFDMAAPPTNPRQAPQPPEWLHRRWTPDEPTTMKVIKVIQGSSGGWTITDAHLSPDNERLVSPVIRLLRLSANSESFIPLS